MDYHPHVHLLVSGGGIGEDRATWREAQHPFLVPVRALSKLVRGKFHDALKKERPDLEAQLPPGVWTREWVAWCKSWGQGESAVLDYLARYVHRIAIANRRILAMDERTVTFRYKDRKRQQWCTGTLTGHEFMRRFLQHVLPKGFHKVRYYGLWHPAQRPQRQNARRALLLKQAQAAPEAPTPRTGCGEVPSGDIAPVTCPHCGSHATRHLGPLPRGHPTRASPADTDTS
jgi:hypothetical protein